MIPNSALVPDYSEYQFERLFDVFCRMTLMMDKLKINEEEIQYIRHHPKSFEQFSFGSLNISQWKRLQSFTAFRDSLPGTSELPIKHLYNWVSSKKQRTTEPSAQEIVHDKSLQAADSSLLPSKMSSSTGWNEEQVSQVLKWAYHDEDTSQFGDERTLLQMLEILDFVNKSGVDIDHLYTCTALEPLELSESALEISKNNGQSMFEARF